MTGDKVKVGQKIIPEIEFDSHRIIVVGLFLATILLVLFTAGILNYSEIHQDKILTTLMVVIIAGVLGSLVSALNRIYSSKDIFPKGQYKELLKGANTYLLAYSAIPPLIGAISAAILYLIFAGDIISGAMFPEFACNMSDNNCNEFNSFMSHWGPKEPTDYAKAIVWGFIAGFSERFVPDILNKVSSDASK